ncbi:MAG TPA: hypothetical protein VNT50_00815 [Microbacterium sp.]|uniref:hypothetical protein n=1 Tax=Microbacterium sp. TaxID=51671 RepID=UPI002B9771E2|nr:hypothetical protein [Microbacterium sp.]HWI30007.1 hypothetical protein [Microbacterium sp.]
MSRTRLWRIIAWAVAVIGAFTLGLLLTRCISQSGNVALEGSGDGEADHDRTFAVAGDLSEPVGPGILVPLDLSISNPHGETLLISELVVTVRSVDAPNATASLPCTVDDFVVEQLDGAVEPRVEPGDTRTLAQLDIPESDWPRVGMVDADANQDGCKDATLVLSYTATGRLES